MNRRLLIIGLIGASLGVIVMLVRGVAREVLVIPLLEVIWGITQVIESLPQSLVWALLIFIAIAMLVRQTFVRPVIERHAPSEAVVGGQVARWARLIQQAQHDQYARWRTAQRLALLAIELIAYREGLDIRAARRRLETGIGLPANIQAYLNAGLAQRQPPAPNMLVQLTRGQRADPLQLNPELVIAELERLHEPQA